MGSHRFLFKKLFRFSWSPYKFSKKKGIFLETLKLSNVKHLNCLVEYLRVDASLTVICLGSRREEDQKGQSWVLKTSFECRGSIEVRCWCLLWVVQSIRLCGFCCSDGKADVKRSSRGVIFLDDILWNNKKSRKTYLHWKRFALKSYTQSLFWAIPQNRTYD